MSREKRRVMGSRRSACVATSLLLAAFAALRGADVAADFVIYEEWYVGRSIDSGFIERPGYFEALYFLLSDLFLKAGIVS